MLTASSISAKIIEQAESFSGVRAGIASVSDVLRGPSYQAAPEGIASISQVVDSDVVEWPANCRSVLVLGLNHPENDPRLDWWERGDTWGNRRLREISDVLKTWLRKTLDLGAHPLPYHLEAGGIFLKDAAVLSGLGIIGRNNLLLHPEWGPKIRLRSILIEGELHPTKPIEDFSPCDTCGMYCQKACPMKAFAQGTYNRKSCSIRIRTDVENKAPDGEIHEEGQRNLVIKYCRLCELACQVA